MKTNVKLFINDLKFAILLLIVTISFSFTISEKEIYMEGHDNLRFTVDKIEASPGQKLKVTLKTLSALPKSQMAHNFVLLKKNTDVMKFANESLKHEKNDYIAPSMEDQIIAMTGMLGDEESETITFNAPSEPGEYMYICTFPGHYHAGMKGKLIVK